MKNQPPNPIGNQIIVSEGSTAQHITQLNETLVINLPATETQMFIHAVIGEGAGIVLAASSVQAAHIFMPLTYTFSQLIFSSIVIAIVIELVLVIFSICIGFLFRQYLHKKYIHAWIASWGGVVPLVFYWVIVTFIQKDMTTFSVLIVSGIGILFGFISGFVWFKFIQTNRVYPSLIVGALIGVGVLASLFGLQ